MVCYLVNTNLQCVPLFLACLLSATINCISIRIICNHNNYIENASPYMEMFVATNAICCELFAYQIALFM